MQVTIYKNIKSKVNNHISVQTALERIKSGKSKSGVLSVRNSETKEIADEIKKTLPCVCFSGKFGPNHDDASLTEHSGLIILDFDHLEDPEKLKSEFIKWEYSFAVWISPSGKGVKVLVKIADGKKHRKHFQALKEMWPNADPSGVNESRLCFESYDPEIYINEQSKVWTTIIQTEIQTHTAPKDSDYETFQKLLTWLTRKGKAFAQGDRNNFIYLVAGACCRFGMSEDTAIGIISGYAISDSSFSRRECVTTVKSAYRKNAPSFGSAEFSNERLVVKNTREEVNIELTKEDIEELNKQNVIYAEDVSEELDDLYEKGYEQLKGIGVPEIDHHYKRKIGELTVLTGYGNMGKSTYWLWYLVMRAVLYGEKAALFSPEADPPRDFYWDIIEIYLGANCLPSNPNRPNHEQFKRAKKWVAEHFFDVTPSELAPTPQVIKETFLSLILSKDVKSVVVDPFNQLTNDYSSTGGRSDKYLETFLSDCARFAKKNGVNFDIIAHPKTPHPSEKDGLGDYPCPDQFKIADGTMWNNKADNILVYHRPFGFSSPAASNTEVHSKKIRRQKIVGEKGFVEMDYIREKRRFFIKGRDYLQEAIDAKNKVVQTEIVEDIKVTALKPNLDFTNRYSSADLKEASEGSEVDRIYDEIEQSKKWNG